MRRFIGITEVMKKACAVVLSGLNTRKTMNIAKDEGILIAVTGKKRKQWYQLKL